MMKKSLVFLLLLSLSALSGAEMKIAVVDMGKVFQEYNMTRIEEAKLRKQAEMYREYSVKLGNSLQKLQEEFKKLRDGSLNMALSQAERENRRLNAQEKYTEVEAKKKELADYNREKQNELRDQYEKMRENLLKEIGTVISAKAQAEGYSLVLDKSGKSLNNIPSVIYSTPSVDITEEVLKTLNLGQLPAPKKGTSAK